MPEPIYDLVDIIPTRLNNTFFAVGVVVGMFFGIPAGMTVLLLIDYAFK